MTASTEGGTAGTPLQIEDNFQLRRVLFAEAPEHPFQHDLGDQEPPIVGFHLFGKCPRCRHDTSDVFPVKVKVIAPREPGARPRFQIVRRWRGGDSASNGSEQTDTDDELTRIGLQRCRCPANHAGSDGKFGCGANWLVRATFDPTAPGQKVSFGSVSNELEAARYWPAADAFASSLPDALTTVQANAGKWQTGLTAILGIVGAVALIGGRDTIQKLGPLSKGALVALAALGLLTNLVAIMLATVANSGVPKMMKIRNASKVRNSDLATLIQTRHAIDRLRAAVAAALIAFFASIAAVGVLWLSPDRAVPGPTVDLKVEIAGRTLTTCGTFSAAQAASGYFTFLPAGSTSATIYSSASVISISPTSSC